MQGVTTGRDCCHLVDILFRIRCLKHLEFQTQFYSMSEQDFRHETPSTGTRATEMCSKVYHFLRPTVLTDENTLLQNKMFPEASRIEMLRSGISKLPRQHGHVTVLVKHRSFGQTPLSAATDGSGLATAARCVVMEISGCVNVCWTFTSYTCNPHKIAGQTSPSIHPPIGNSYASRDFLP